MVTTQAIITLLVLPSLCSSVSFDLSGSSSLSLYTADLSIPAGASENVLVMAVPAAVSYLLVQAHAQTVPLQMSQVTPAGPEAVEGRHVGLVTRIPPGQTAAGPITVVNLSAENATVFLAVIPHGNNVPVPGGCSQTETVPVAPFFRLQTFHKAFTTFAVPRAELGVNRSMTFTCNSARYVLEYKTYLVYRPGDLRANYTLFRDALSDMLTPDRIQKNSRTVQDRNPARPMQWTLALYPSQAAVYGATVAVRGVPGAVAAYVPAVRHACPLADQPGEDYCRAHSLSTEWTLDAVLSVLGALMLTLAAASLTVEVLISTLLLVGGLAALLFRLLILDDVLAATGVGAALGLVCALLLVRKWTWDQWSRGTMLTCSCLLFGAAAIAMLFMIPALQVLDMTVDLVFWPGFVLGAGLVSTVGRLPSLDKSSTLMRCFLGALWVSYGLGLAVDSIYPYMFVDLYRRALYPQFRFALQAYSAGVQDYVCVSVLLLLVVVPAALSCYLRQVALSPRQEYDRLPRCLRLPLLYPPAQYWDLVGERAPLLQEGEERGPLRGQGPEYGSVLHRTPQRSA